MGMNNDFGAGPDDADPDDSYSPAPQPPHERMWRHPSEVGFATVTLQALTPIDIGRRGRGLVGFSCIAGSILISGLLLVLIPRSGHQSTSDIVALTNADLHVAAVDSHLSASTAMGIILFNNQIFQIGQNYPNFRYSDDLSWGINASGSRTSHDSQRCSFIP